MGVLGLREGTAIDRLTGAISIGRDDTGVQWCRGEHSGIPVR